MNGNGKKIIQQRDAAHFQGLADEKIVQHDVELQQQCPDKNFLRQAPVLDKVEDDAVERVQLVSRTFRSQGRRQPMPAKNPRGIFFQASSSSKIPSRLTSSDT